MRSATERQYLGRGFDFRLPLHCTIMGSSGQYSRMYLIGALNLQRNFQPQTTKSENSRSELTLLSILPKCDMWNIWCIY